MELHGGALRPPRARRLDLCRAPGGFARLPTGSFWGRGGGARQGRAKAWRVMMMDDDDDWKSAAAARLLVWLKGEAADSSQTSPNGFIRKWIGSAENVSKREFGE